MASSATTTPSPFPNAARPDRKGRSMIYFTPSFHADAPARQEQARRDREWVERKRVSSFQSICKNARSISRSKKVARIDKLRSLANEIQSIMANGEAISPGRDVRDSPQIKELWSKPNGRTVSNVSAISHQTGNDSSFVKEWLESFDARARLFAHSAERKRQDAAKAITFGKVCTPMRTPAKSHGKLLGSIKPGSNRNVSWAGNQITEIDFNNSSFHVSRPHSRVMDLLEMGGRVSQATTNDISISEDKVRYLEEKWRPKDIGDFTRKLRLKLTTELSIADKSFKLVKIQDDMKKQQIAEKKAEKEKKEEERKRRQQREMSRFLQIGA